MLRIERNVQIGLIIAVLCCIIAVSGCTSNNTTAKNNTSSNNSDSNLQASSEVLIVVDYAGSWAVDVSGAFGYRSFSGTGSQTNNIGTVSGTVTAAARKTDNGNGLLTVSITKDGKTLASQSTSYPYGGATAVATGI